MMALAWVSTEALLLWCMSLDVPNSIKVGLVLIAHLLVSVFFIVEPAFLSFQSFLEASDLILHIRIRVGCAGLSWGTVRHRHRVRNGLCDILRLLHHLLLIGRLIALRRVTSSRPCCMARWHRLGRLVLFSMCRWARWSCISVLRRC